MYILYELQWGSFIYVIDAVSKQLLNIIHSVKCMLHLFLLPQTVPSDWERLVD